MFYVDPQSRKAFIATSLFAFGVQSKGLADCRSHAGNGIRRYITLMLPRALAAVFTKGRGSRLKLWHDRRP